MNQNILFYSTKCKICASLFRLLKSENMLQFFQCVCVDDPRIRIPKGITSVPTAVIPSLNKFLVANEIFLWIDNIRKSRLCNLNTLSAPVNVQNNVINQNGRNEQNKNNTQINIQQKNTTQQNGPIGFVSQEMTGVSDTYAYTAVDAVPQHTYVSCNEMDKNTIFTVPEKETKITLSVQPNYMKNVDRKRKEQDDAIKELFEKQRQSDALSYIDSKRHENEQKINQIVEKQQQNIIGLLTH